MRIGIDAKWYFTGPVSTRVILQNVLPELFSQFPEHEWVLFLDKKDEALGAPFQMKNVHIEYIWAGNNMLSNLFVLPGYLRKDRVDAMVFQTFPSFRRKVPAVAFIHDVLFREYPRFFSWKERLYFLPLAWLTRNRADRLIATTECVATDLLKYAYTRSRSSIDIVPLGVNRVYRPVEDQDSSWLAEVKKKFGLPDRYLLYVGRLNVRKNIESLLRSLPMIQDRKIPLVIVGKEDWKAPDLQESLSVPGVRERIIFTGAMTDEELMATYAMAKVFCFPSFAEGFGLPPLEAMASGIPVIVSETTSLPEVCGDAAVYIDPKRPESIASALDTLLTDNSLYNRKVRLGLDRASAYTWGRTGAALMASIKNALKTNK